MRSVTHSQDGREQDRNCRRLEQAPTSTRSRMPGVTTVQLAVIGGLEAIRALKTSGLEPVRSVELLLFTSEEPTRFGIGCLGSRLLSGSLAPSVGDTLRDKDGMSLNQARSSAGFTGDL